MQWFDPDHDYVNEYIDTWNQKIRSAKTWMIALGAVLVLTGIASAVAPLGMYALIQASRASSQACSSFAAAQTLRATSKRPLSSVMGQRLPQAS